MIRRPPRSTQSRSSAASDVYKRQDYIFAHLGVDDHGLVPSRWEVSQKLHKFGFSPAFGGIAGKYLHGTIIDHEHRQLMTTGPRARYHPFDRSCPVFGGIVQEARFIIESASEHSGKGQGNIVPRSYPIAPHIVLRTKYTLPAHGIGIGSIEPLCWKCPVVHDHNPVSYTHLT